MKISIITVVRNNEKMIGGCIKSVVGQTYEDIEYIVIDGASSDGTFNVINKYRDKISKIVSEKDDGHIYAMNKALKMASGDVVGFLHSDDFYAGDDIIEKVAGVFAKVDTDSLYGDLVYVKKNDPGKVIRYWKSGNFEIAKIRDGWMPAHPTFFVKKNIYDKYGFFDTSYKISMDYENVLRLLYMRTISTYYLPQVMVKMRLGGQSNSGLKNIIKKTAEDYKACRAYGLGIGTVFKKNMAKIPQFFLKDKKSFDDKSS